MKRVLSLLMAFVMAFSMMAQSFSAYFEDATLRMDLTLAGNQNETYVYLDEFSRLNVWGGRQERLNERQNLGVGLVQVKDAQTGEVIYTTTFCTLFNEWQCTDQAKSMNRSFQQVVLLPYPKKKVTISVDFRGFDGVFKNYMNVEVDPQDILIRPKQNTGFKTEYVFKSGSPAECIDIAIVGEGYTTEEQDKFFADAKRVTSFLFAHAPFDKLKDRFNVVAVGAVSKESGATEPGKRIWRNTLMNTHYDTFYSQRYLMTGSLKAVNDALVDVPYEQIVILVNTPTYGGGGIYNSHTVIGADDKTTDVVIVHEFGHSFLGLGDEYFYPGDAMENFYNKKVEPWEPNITTLVDFDSKWKDLLPSNCAIPTPVTDDSKKKLGVFEGGGYATKGIYRPMYDCRMRTNAAPGFCPVCTRAIEQCVDFLTK